MLGGSFPVLTTISNIYSAYSAYAVYFGLNRAEFDINSMPEVVTSTRMYVITPPGDAPGFVDVRVEDLSDPTIFDVLEDGYVYLLGGIGQWLVCDIIPRPVGRLLSGQLQVELIVTGFIDNAFIVPQGGDPFNISHRINLDNTGGDFWSNVESIDTLLIDNDSSGGPTFGDFFADGHAAVYVQSWIMLWRVVKDWIRPIGLENDKNFVNESNSSDKYTDLLEEELKKRQ